MSTTILTPTTTLPTTIATMNATSSSNVSSPIGALLPQLLNVTTKTLNDTLMSMTMSAQTPARFLFTGNGSTVLLEPVSVMDHLAADQFAALPNEAGLPAPAEVKQTPVLKLVHDYLLVILLVSVMFSMGCGVTLLEVWNHLKRPTSVTVCLIAQFFIVPFVAYCLIVTLHLDVLHATGLLILACCPGGVTSNIFTYIADGDLSLSITMTSVATIAALLLMPLNVWMYGRNLETNNLVIPYMEMSGTLILVTIPVLIGMALNWRYPRYTPYITKVGVFSGFGIICFCQSLEIFIFPDIFVGVPAKMYAAVFLLPAISFFTGLLFAKLCRLNEKVCRTIGIEIGIKNVGSALTIVSLSFSIDQLKKAWVFPFLYAFSSFAVIFVVIIIYKWLVNNQIIFRRDSSSTSTSISSDEQITTRDKDRIRAEEELEGLTTGVGVRVNRAISVTTSESEMAQIVKTKNGRILLPTYERP